MTSKIDKLLDSPIARKAAELVTQEKLQGTTEERISAWGAVMTVCLNSHSDDELNRWWQWVLGDGVSIAHSYKTVEDLFKFAQWKICDLDAVARALRVYEARHGSSTGTKQ